MQYILIVHPASMLSSINNKIIPSAKWIVEELGSGGVRQVFIRSNNSNCFVRLELTNKLPSQDFGYTEEEYALFEKLSKDLEVTFVKYSDLQTLREISNLLSEHLDFYIDNDHGKILLSNDFMQLWNENSAWNWAKESLAEM